MRRSITSRCLEMLSVITVVQTFTTCEAFKILMITQPAKSHLVSQARIGEGLTRNGNIVHFLISKDIDLVKSQMVEMTSSFKIERYGSTNAAGDVVVDYAAVDEEFVRKVLENKGSFAEVLPHIKEIINNQTESFLSGSEALVERLSKEKFDVAVVDSNVYSKYSYLLPLRLGVPWVTYTDTLPPWIVKVPYLPSFVPSATIGMYSEKMSFTERFQNTIYEFGFQLYIDSIGMGEPSEDIVRNYRKYGNFKTMDDLIAQSLLFITPTDTILDYAKPLMPNIISAAGLTVKPGNVKSLPEDIERFMAEAKTGVILVSFGSLASSFPSPIEHKLLSTFNRLGSDNYRILFRFSNRDKLPIPNHVKISRWLPQNDLLSDPRVKLFITHCGNNGQYEAVYHGVPMIGFPLFGDQPYNAKRLVHKGYGLAMDIYSFTPEDLYQNIIRITTNSSYKESVQHASEIFKSTRVTPVENAAYWIEHVARFGGEHLRSAGSDLNLFQYLCLDVLLVVIVIIVAFSFCVCKMFSFICRKCCLQSKSISTKKKHE